MGRRTYRLVYFGNDLVPVGYENDFSFSNQLKVAAEVIFKIFDSDGFHIFKVATVATCVKY